LTAIIIPSFIEMVCKARFSDRRLISLNVTTAGAFEVVNCVVNPFAIEPDPKMAFPEAARDGTTPTRADHAPKRIWLACHCGHRRKRYS
jgi:hypothetical protein